MVKSIEEISKKALTWGIKHGIGGQKEDVFDIPERF